MNVLLGGIWFFGWLFIFLLPVFLTIYFIVTVRSTRKRIGASVYTPYVSILLPFKGLDDNFESTIQKLLKQQYTGAYEVLCVTSEEESEAARVVKKFAFSDPKLKLIIAKKITGYRSDKVNNLLSGIENASLKAEVFAVIDSDIIPHDTWLLDLVQPLVFKDCGVSSGSAWIVGKHADLLSYATRYWDFLATIQMTFPLTSFARGFSMAFKREVFEKIEMQKVWENAFHDNLTLTDVIKRNALKIYYAPSSFVSHCFSIKRWQWVEWVKRQSLNTRINYPHLWRYGFFFITLPRFVGAIGFLIAVMLTIVTEDFLNAYTSIFLLWPIFHSVSAFFLITTVYPERKKYDDYHNGVSTRLWMTLGSFISVVLSFGSILAVITRKVAWRGNVYYQYSPFKTTFTKEK